MGGWLGGGDGGTGLCPSTYEGNHIDTWDNAADSPTDAAAADLAAAALAEACYCCC